MTRMAIIGLGYWGPNLVRNFFALQGDKLRMCCDKDPARTELIASTYPTIQMTSNPREILENPEIDAVAIATPVDSHYGLARAALEAGKSVLVEKPLTSDVAQAEELVDLANRKGLVLMVDHVFVYSGPVRKMKEIVDTGELGDLLFIDSVRINLGLFQRDVNVVWDLAPHDLSIVDYLLEKLPRSVSAFGSAHTGQEIEDVAYLNLDFGDGLIANFHVNWLSPVKIRYTMVGGRKKSLIYNDLEPSERIKVHDSGINVSEGDLETRRGVLIEYRTGDVYSPFIPQREPLREVARHFIECVEEGKVPTTNGECGLRVVRILEAAQRSIRAQGGRVTL